ncbi:DUF5691 domain-containing protein [Streptomyces sp. NBC_00536]|uniref:DUF5691 domain-containing protein n=1 Tax=Streptomyces sp. NBC_00536 TaxID=2975769 RepID=UPI002E805D20|nr:DUF5691 domain-containing protein [Streptomyces sp. NBC_00536]WUC80765.1 DUF5691 domain-containing protein [Streptomyces sp. NBC_00536]
MNGDNGNNGDKHEPVNGVDAGGVADWEELVGVALLGTERRRGDGAAGSPEALLDAAAVTAVRRRAGLRPAAAGPRPDPAAPDPRPAPPDAARRRLAQLLAGRTGGGGRRGAAPDLTELLPQWLAAAVRHGYRAPAALVPALLDAARARTDLRPQALALAGGRGRWLARLNPEWRFALRGGAGGGELPAPDDRAGVERLWQEGLFAERVALLGAVRAHEAAAAPLLLSTTWATERAEDRLMFLDSLRSGLSQDDEPFLERALGDRSRNVRATAAELLSALPGSALAGRMAERALACVGPDGVVPPGECDAGMQRDGVVERPPAGRGERAWWLGQLVEAAPLSCWRERFGGLDPAGILALPVAEGWAEELHAAWCRAAVRQRDPLWSKALLGSASAPPAAGPATASLAERAKLLETLSEEERARWVAEFVRAHGLSEAFQLLGVCVVPWAEELGSAVVDALDSARNAGSYPWSFSGVMGLAERCLDPAAADRLESLLAVALAEEISGEAGRDQAAAEVTPGAEAYWAEAFQRLVSTLRLRAAMLAELAGSGEPAEPAPAPAA